MRTLYVPKGRAHEYSPLALNVYTVCAHGCCYCYGRRLTCMRFTDSARSVTPRRGIVDALAAELKTTTRKREQVLLSFIGDPYGPAADDNKATADCLRLLRDAGWPAAVLTKGGNRCLKDVELFQSFEGSIQVGMTLTMAREDYSRAVEPQAAPPAERLAALKELHRAGVRTFVSFEPILNSQAVVDLVCATLLDDSVDVYKFGVLSGGRRYGEGAGALLVNDERARKNLVSDIAGCVQRLRNARKGIYVKQSLAKKLNDVLTLTAQETNPRAYDALAPLPLLEWEARA